MDFDKLLTTKKVLVCCGSGGVGKTTMAAALAVRAAELNKKVMVLTIDPAKRLATSLGLNQLDEEVRVGEGLFAGELYASQLNIKRTFDNFVSNFAPSDEVAEKVLQNKIYQQLSTTLSGSQEYTSLEKLLQYVTSGKYDLVILDTPPAKHAVDFLHAPAKIHTLFQDSITKWFLLPFTAVDKVSFGLWNRGTKAAFKIFETIVGVEFLLQLGEFFSNIRDWQKTLRERTAEVHRLLTSQATGFILVTGYSTVKIEEARFFERSLSKGGYDLSAIIVNRAFPLWSVRSKEFEEPSIKTENYKKLKDFYDELRHYYESQQEAFRIFAGEMRAGTFVAKLPDFDQDVHNLEDLKKTAHKLSQSLITKETIV